MKKLTIVFVDAEIELAEGPIPLLDAFYYPQVKGRQGRPDVVHNALTILRSSALWPQVDVAVYTKNGEVIIPDKEPFVQNYLDFTQRLAQLLQTGSAEGYTLQKMDFPAFIRSLQADKIIALSPDGEDVPLKENLAEQHTVLLIGAFVDGDYTSPVYELADLAVSLSSDILTVPEVLMRLLKELS
ncbi:hypothetical protein [Candidatus Methanomassiliicoccus intestinalis]|uniref:hypothetical protein n=1 Tax=Candidatus Methanomassiliicoccus intestinalis TaxID=1406512 RepID=UPI0037DCE6FF